MMTPTTTTTTVTILPPLAGKAPHGARVGMREGGMKGGDMRERNATTVTMTGTTNTVPATTHLRRHAPTTRGGTKSARRGLTTGEVGERQQAHAAEAIGMKRERRA
eukprot:Hpha_TRINITY_DN15551_c3_g1::TRINITY_DN15551_c3_g1_i1::g.106585::m.106585